MIIIETPCRRQFRFSLRTLFGIVLLFGAPFACLRFENR